MKPKWQRAKVIGVSDSSWQEWIGLELWVQIGSPKPVRDTIDPRTGARSVSDEPSYIVNITDERGRTSWVEHSHLELLARDENDFAEEVPIIRWEKALEDYRNLKSAS